MSDILTKSLRTGSPGIPGTPSTPGTPSYTTYVSVRIPIYSVPTYDPSTGQYTYPPWDPNAPGNSIGIGTGPPPGYIPAPPNYTGVPVLVTYRVVQEPVNHPGTPATPGTPGTPPVPADYYQGWNSGADSINSLTDPGEFLFSVPGSSVGVVAGLSNLDGGDGSYRNIQWGIYFHTGLFSVIENGTVRTSQLTYVDSDVFAIVVSGGVVSYFQNTTLLYTSTVPYTSPVAAFAAMYMGSDQVVNAAFSAVDPLLGAVTANCAGNLLGLQGFAADNSFAAASGWGAGGLRGLSGSSTSSSYGTGAGNLTGLSGWSSDSTFVEACSGNLGGLSGNSESNLLAPNYAVAYGYLGALQGFAYDGISYNGNGAGNLLGLQGFSLAFNANLGGWGSGALQKLQGWGVDGTQSPGWFTGVLSGNGPGMCYGLVAWGTVGYTGATGFRGTLLTHPTVLGYSGGLAYLTAPQTLPHYPLSASGTVTIFGEAYLTAPVKLPHYPLLATGGQTIGRGYLATNGRYVVVGQGGATGILTAPVTAPHYLITAHGFGGQLGEVVVALGRHRYVVTASGTLPLTYGAVAGNLITLSAGWSGRSGVAAANQPRYQLLAYGHQVVALAYEAYAMTLDGDKDVALIGTTHYTNYPFDRIVRFGTKYFGVAADGLYELSGNTFNGTAIIATVQTGETDMGDPALKRPRRLYIAGRLSQDLQVSVIARENETDTYTYDPVLGGARNTRVPIGRGIEARYLAFAFQNLDGQDFELQELGPEVDELRRTA